MELIYDRLELINEKSIECDRRLASVREDEDARVSELRKVKVEAYRLNSEAQKLYDEYMHLSEQEKEKWNRAKEFNIQQESPHNHD